MADVIDLVPFLEKKRKKEAARRDRQAANEQLLGPKKRMILPPSTPVAEVRPLISRRDVEFFRLLASISGTTSKDNNPAVASLMVDHSDFEE